MWCQEEEEEESSKERNFTIVSFRVPQSNEAVIAMDPHSLQMYATCRHWRLNDCFGESSWHRTMVSPCDPAVSTTATMASQFCEVEEDVKRC